MFDQLKLKINDYLFIKIVNFEIIDLILCYIYVVQNDSTNEIFEFLNQYRGIPVRFFRILQILHKKFNYWPIKDLKKVKFQVKRAKQPKIARRMVKKSIGPGFNLRYSTLYVLILSNNFIPRPLKFHINRVSVISIIFFKYYLKIERKRIRLTILTCKCIIIITRYIIKANLSSSIPHFTTAFLKRYPNNQVFTFV